MEESLLLQAIRPTRTRFSPCLAISGFMAILLQGHDARYLYACLKLFIIRSFSRRLKFCKIYFYCSCALSSHFSPEFCSPSKLIVEENANFLKWFMIFLFLSLWSLLLQGDCFFPFWHVCWKSCIIAIDLRLSSAHKIYLYILNIDLYQSSQIVWRDVLQIPVYLFIPVLEIILICPSLF